jgi:hypothetical protein
MIVYIIIGALVTVSLVATAGYCLDAGYFHPALIVAIASEVLALIIMGSICLLFT